MNRHYTKRDLARLVRLLRDDESPERPRHAPTPIRGDESSITTQGVNPRRFAAMKQLVNNALQSEAAYSSSPVLDSSYTDNPPVWSGVLSSFTSSQISAADTLGRTHSDYEDVSVDLHNLVELDQIPRSLGWLGNTLTLSFARTAEGRIQDIYAEVDVGTTDALAEPQSPLLVNIIDQNNSSEDLRLFPSCPIATKREINLLGPADTLTVALRADESHEK